MSQARRLVGLRLGISRTRLMLSVALVLAALVNVSNLSLVKAEAQQDSVLAVEVDVEPVAEAQVSVLSNSDADYTSLNRVQGYAQAYLRTAARNRAWLSYNTKAQALVMACSQASGTLVSLLPLGLEYRASGKQVLLELLGGYPDTNTGTVYCNNLVADQTAVYLTGVGALELGSAEFRLDLTRGQTAAISVLRGQVLFRPSGDVPWLTEPISVEAGQTVTLNLATAAKPATASYDATSDDRDTFDALRQRVARAVNASAPTVPGRIAVDDTSAISFPSQPVGASGQPKFVLVANPGQTSTNLSAHSLSPDFRVDSGSCPPSLDPSGSCALSVTFTPAGRGTRSGTLEINSSSLLVPIHIPLLGVGIDSGAGRPPFR